jgi:8-oxo-dGTP pyrophosphatase MutT (NUDIX family)
MTEDILFRMTSVLPRPAATVVVIRDAPPPCGFEVLMVRRSDRAAFMAGAFVFPGGRVDESDGAGGPPVDPMEWPSRFADLTPLEEQSYRAAAARELAEEAGVRVEPRTLVPFAHWVTPDVDTRRFDTRFFLASMPDDQQPRPDEGETTALAWLSPPDALRRAGAGEIVLPPPTWTTLARLERFDDAARVFAWAHALRIVRVQPRLVRDEHQTLLTLPGDPTFPTLDGWEIPEHTRFSLLEGQWRPVRA